MGKKSTQFDVDAIAAEARENYDMSARLRGIGSRKQEVVVYTDVATGAELGGAEDRVVQGLNMGRRRWGLKGRLEEIGERAETLAKVLEEAEEPTEEQLAEVAALEAEQAEIIEKIKPLAKRLYESSIAITLQALPRLVRDDVVDREVRKILGIKGKVPQSLQAEWKRQYAAVLLSKSVETWVDRADGKTRAGMDVDTARDLYDWLPEGEFDKLDREMYKLSFEAVIGAQATDSADF